MAILNTVGGGGGGTTDARVQLATTGYRICVNREYSAEFDYGIPAEWEAPDGKRYLAYVDVEGEKEEGEDVDTPLEYWLYEVTPVAGEPEDVGDFDAADSGDGGSEEDDGTDDADDEETEHEQN